MADGSTRPISEVNIGDKVAATDPVSGKTVDKSVTMLHANHDTDLTLVVSAAVATVAAGARTVGEGDGERSTRGPTVTLETTAHHPFWDVTEGAWVDAADLHPGHQLWVYDDTTDLTGEPDPDQPGAGGAVTATVTNLVNSRVWWAMRHGWALA